MQAPHSQAPLGGVGMGWKDDINVEGVSMTFTQKFRNCILSGMWGIIAGTGFSGIIKAFGV